MILISLAEEIQIMLDFNLTAEQYLFLKLLWIAQQEGASKYLYQYYHERELRTGETGGIPFSLVQDLLDRGILTYDGDFTPKEVSEYDSFKIVKGHKWFMSIYPHAEEFFTVYPSFMMSGGRSYPIKNIAKHFSTLEELYSFYGSNIKYSFATHQRNMQALEYAIQHDLVKCSIVEWIISKKWLEFKTDVDEQLI